MLRSSGAFFHAGVYCGPGRCESCKGAGRIGAGVCIGCRGMGKATKPEGGDTSG